MPRRPKSFLAPVKRRTRTGCQTCRRRKIKCSEDKPVCDQCKQKGLECITTATLKWEEDYLSRGLAFGRCGVWSKAPSRDLASTPDFDEESAIWCPIPYIQPYSFLNSTTDSIRDGTTTHHHDFQPLSLRLEAPSSTNGDDDDLIGSQSLSPWIEPQKLMTSSLTMLPAPPITPLGYDQDKSLLLSYYIEMVCPLTMPTLTSSSPFATLLMPYAMSSSPLALDSMLALAACHRSRSNPKYKSTALRLSQSVLQTLRIKLGTSDSLSVAMNPESLVVMLLLCLFEIVNECDKRWTVHLKGARDLIRIRRANLSLSTFSTAERQLAQFCERFFAFQDVIGRTACGEDPIFGSDFWTSTDESCDPWLGCSSELMSILSSITELSRVRSSVGTSTDFQSSAAFLEQRLANLDQTIWDQEDTTLAQSAELKRLAAELYLQCALNGADPSYLFVSEQVLKILEAVSVLLELNLVSGLSWALFIAAVELDPYQELEMAPSSDGTPRLARPFILYALDMLSGSMVNVARTRSVIEKVWQARELQGDDEIDEQGDKNDWETFVAPLCTNMSLA